MTLSFLRVAGPARVAFSLDSGRSWNKDVNVTWMFGHPTDCAYPTHNTWICVGVFMSVDEQTRTMSFYSEVMKVWQKLLSISLHALAA